MKFVQRSIAKLSILWTYKTNRFFRK